MKKKKDLISIIVPCYNEEEVLDLFYAEINKVFNEMDVDHELIFVDDGSSDQTLNVLMRLAKDPKVTYLSFSRHFGKEAGMLAGLANASGDFVGFIDADLQHPPVLLKQMYEALQDEEYDCAACRRMDRKGDKGIRTFFSRLFYKMINAISDTKLIDGAGDYRLLRRNMVEALMSMSEYNRFSKGLFSWIGFKTYWIEYENVSRASGKTSWSFWGLVKYAFDGFMSFSNAPLELASVFGMITTMASFIYLLFIVIKYALYGDPVQGWATIVCIILLLGGIQLLSLGIIGQYVGKTYLEVKDRPHFIIARTNKKDAIKIK